MSPKQRHTSDLTENPVAFSCDSDTTEAVCLAGSFNKCDPTANPMEGGNGGHWTASLPLAPGRYEYKFVVDGG